ncbi:MAG: hypothetical protein CMJ74_03900 [Planctomycetaceae bacterium]|nr:hypothetical protein [Planctomycetaceae bacterium]
MIADVLPLVSQFMRSNNPLKFIFLAIYLFLFFTEGSQNLGVISPCPGGFYESKVTRSGKRD